MERTFFWKRNNYLSYLKNESFKDVQSFSTGSSTEKKNVDKDHNLMFMQSTNNFWHLWIFMNKHVTCEVIPISNIIKLKLEDSISNSKYSIYNQEISFIKYIIYYLLLERKKEAQNY